MHIRVRFFLSVFCIFGSDNRFDNNGPRVNLTNALKSLGNLRKYHCVSNAMKLCDCIRHKNMDYLESHTSLRKFTNAILCPAIEYESISGNHKSLNSIQEQETINITASNDKEKNKKREKKNS